jgi:hypothetical protein
MCAVESGLGKRGAANQRTYSGDDASNYNAPPQRTVTHFLALDKVLPGRYVKFMYRVASCFLRTMYNTH